MRTFHKVDPRIWGKRPFKKMSVDGKLAMLYFLTSAHQNSSGYHHLPDGYASHDLGMDVEQYVKARREVADSGMVLFDEETHDLYVVGWFEENPITNEKHYQGCLRVIQGVDSETVGDAAMEELEKSYEKQQHATSEKKKRAQNNSGYGEPF
jgi:hypothetical protein